MKFLRVILFILLLVPFCNGAVKTAKTSPSDYAKINMYNNGPAFSSNWSFCVWFKSNVVNPGVNYQILSHMTFTYTQVEFYFDINPSGHIEAWDQSSFFFTGTANVVDGNWHSWCVTRGASNDWNSYVDGTLDASVTHAWVQAAPDGNGTSLSANGATDNTCNCTFAEAVWYQTVLTADQIRAYSRGVTPSVIDAFHYTGVGVGTYWPLYFWYGAGPGFEHSDEGGGGYLGDTVFGHGSYATDGHCPCSPPAGAESH